MRNKHKNQADGMPFSKCLVATAVFILLLLLVGSSVALAQDGSAFVRKVREIEASDLGLSNPAGLSFSPEANAFHIVEARGADQPYPLVSDIAVVTLVQGQAETVRVTPPVSLTNPINIAFDGKANRLLLLEPATEELIEIAVGPGGVLDPTLLTRHDARRFGLQNPQGMTVDPASGRLFVLDSTMSQIVRIEPEPDGSFGESVITRVDLARMDLPDLRGLAFNSANGNLYLLAPTQQELYELTQTGRIAAVYDLSAFALSDPQGMVFAPSGDLTDDPARMSLYIADTGLRTGYDRQTRSQTGGKIIELSFVQLAPVTVTDAATLVFTDTATLIQIIDTSLFSPPSPDASGITYLEFSDTLLMSDSEVEEMPIYFTGDNLFEITLNGTLSDTLTAVTFTEEPTGIAHNPDNKHLFISDDDAQRIYELDPGPDGRYDTTDDIITSIRTGLFNSTDPEGVAFDSQHGVLFITDGMNSEVYRVAPGENDVFDEVPPYGDDEVSSFDTESFGLVDAGGITYDTENGHLYLVGWPRARMAHVTTTGTLLRWVDISAADATFLAGLTMAPGSQDHDVMNIYITDRGVDNNEDPDENDGKVYEMYVPAITPDVAIVKDVQPAAAQAGELITYTLSLSNLGGGTASNVVLTDIIPVSVTVQSVVSSGVDITDTGAVSDYAWEVQDLDTFEGGVITITAVLSENLSCWHSFTNTASITTTGDTRLGNNSSDVSVTVGSSVTVSPTVDTASTDPGSELVYTLQVTNTGNCTDIFDVSASGTSWAVTTPITVGPLAPDTGASVDVTVTVPLEAPCGPESATISFTSQGDGITSDSSILTTLVNPFYGLTLEPSSTAAGDPGTGAAHTLSVTNTGNCTDTFLLASSGGLWSVDTPDPVGPVAAGMDASVNVTVTVPSTATCGDKDSATLTVTSQGDDTLSNSSILTSTANAVSGLTVTLSIDSAPADPGTDVVYTLQVTNTGNCTDTFDVAISGTSWAVTAPLTVGLLAPDVGTSVDVTVTVPLTAPCGNEAVTVTLTSQGDGSTSQSSILTTTVNAVSGVTIVPSSATDYGDPDSDVVYTLQLTNTGNCEDIFLLAISDNTWTTVAPASTEPLTAGVGVSTNVTVTVPFTASCGDEDSATLTVTSQGDGTTSDSSILTTSANPVFGLTVTPASDSDSGDPGIDVIYTVRVTNTGNCTDTFDVAISGTSWAVTAPLTVGLLAPDVGTSVDVTVTVPLNADCGDADSTTVTFTSQSDGLISASSTLNTLANTIYGATIIPPDPTATAIPGDDVLYMLWLLNSGNCEDSFDLTVSGTSWPVTAPLEIGPLTPGTPTRVNVTVTVPLDAPCGDNAATLTATSQANPASSGSAILTTSVNPVYKLAVGPPSDSASGDPGTGVPYTLQVTNTGNCEDIFNIAVSDSTWDTVAPATTEPMAASTSVDVSVTVTVPQEALCGDFDHATITFTSQGDDAQTGSSELTTSANTVHGLTVQPSTDSALGDPGTDIVYTLRVTNTGNCADSFDLAISGNSWTTVATPTVGPVAPGLSASTDITVTVPPTASCSDDDSATITFTSQSDGTQTASSHLSTSAKAVSGLTLTPSSDSLSGDPGTDIVYTLQVTNTGNCTDTFDVSVSGMSWAVTAPLTSGLLAPDVGTNVNVTVTVPLTASCSDDDTVTITFTSQGDGTTAASSDLTTTANAVSGVTVSPPSSTDSGDPGTGVVHTLRVTNTGNCADIFSIAASGYDWTTDAPATSGLLAPGAGSDVDITVTVPQDAQCSDADTATITFTSQGNGTTAATSDLTTLANTVRAATIIPPSDSLSGNVGTDIVYALWVLNSGNCADTFDIAVSGNTWSTNAPSSIGPVAPGIPVGLAVTVTVPLDAQCGSDVATVTATPQYADTGSASSILTTWASAFAGVTVAPSSGGFSGEPGSDVGYTLWVTNTGNCTDTFSIAISGDAWEMSAPSTVGPLDPNEATTVPVTVAVPLNAQCGDGDTASVNFISQRDSTTSDSSILTTSADTVAGVMVEPSSDSASGDPGTDVGYTLWVTNTGNCADTFSIAASGHNWTTEVPAASKSLAPGASTAVDVKVTVSETAQCGDVDTATITFTSQSDGSTSATSDLTTTTNAVSGVTVTPPNSTDSGAPGTDVVYTLRVTNTGNCADTLTIAASGYDWATDVPATSGLLVPGAGTDVDITVTIPQDALCGDADTATITFTSQGDGTTFGSSILTTSADAFYGVTVEPTIAAASGDPDTDLVHTLRVTNTGNCADTFDITASGYNWTTNVPATSGLLAPGAGASVNAIVSVPACTAGGASDAAVVAFVSQEDGSVSAKADLTTTANQVAPIANDDAFSTQEDTPLSVGSPGLLQNDTDANCDPLTATLHVPPTDGSVLLKADGSFAYTPTLNFHGEDSFTYYAYDGLLSTSATVFLAVTSGNDDPVVEAGEDQTVDEGRTVHFAGSFVDPAYRALSAEESLHWSFGDGGTAAGTLTPSHVYRDNGVYTVTLTVIDLEGDAGHDSLLVTVLNVPPSAHAGPDQKAVPGESISFSGNSTDPGLNDTYSIEWDLGNGGIINDTLSFDYAYEAIGVYTVTLTVTDDDGGVGSDTAIVTIRHQVYLPVVLKVFRP